MLNYSVAELRVKFFLFPSDYFYEILRSLFCYLLNFRKFCPHALKGQKLLAQGIALGNYGSKPVAL